MKIEANNTNFQARFVKKTQIQKLIDNKYENYNVNVIELNEKGKQDFNTIRKLAIRWKKCFNMNTFVDSIVHDIEYRKNKKMKNIHIYALTTQRKNFRSLKPEKILGIAEYEKMKPNNTLNYLQTNPMYIKKYNVNKNFQGIGTALLNFFKNKTKRRPIILESSLMAQSFYEKNNFTCIDHINYYYLWKPNKK